MSMYEYVYLLPVPPVMTPPETVFSLIVSSVKSVHRPSASLLKYFAVLFSALSISVSVPLTCITLPLPAIFSTWLFRSNVTVPEMFKEELMVISSVS